MLSNETQRQAIETVLSKVAAQSSPIGNYISHSKTDTDDYQVTLSNGSIRLYHAELESARTLPALRIPDILSRFRPTTK
jgi:hypothetical protein